MWNLMFEIMWFLAFRSGSEYSFCSVWLNLINMEPYPYENL